MRSMGILGGRISSYATRGMPLCDFGIGMHLHSCPGIIQSLTGSALHRVYTLPVVAIGAILLGAAIFGRPEIVRGSSFLS